MATLLPFLRVPDMVKTLQWYINIGFNCIATHEEPGCAIDWALLDWQGARFMLYPHLQKTIPDAYNSGLYFQMENVDGLLEKLQPHANVFEVVEQTEYGRKEITFYDCNNFQVTFSCEP